MGSLTRRPYLLVGFFHMIIGLLLFSCGVAWLVMTFVYWPTHMNDKDKLPGMTAEEFLNNNSWTKLSLEHQVWAWIVYSVQIWSGFWVS